MRAVGTKSGQAAVARPTRASSGTETEATGRTATSTTTATGTGARPASSTATTIFPPTTKSTVPSARPGSRPASLAPTRPATAPTTRPASRPARPATRPATRPAVSVPAVTPPTSAVPPAEQLALGIGNPQALRAEDLRAFCRIVHPLETRCGVNVSRGDLLRTAQEYLQRATPADFLRNAQALSGSSGEVAPRYLQLVEAHTRFYTEQLQRAREALAQVAPAMHDYVAKHPTLSTAARLQLQQCATTAEQFYRSLLEKEPAKT